VGKVLVDGEPVAASPGASIDAGVVLVPEDCRRAGLVPNWSITRNVSLPDRPFLSHHSRFPSSVLEKQRANKIRDELNIRAPDIETNVNSLSGGNAQKVVLGKGMYARPRIILLDEPTAGVDIGSKAEIYQAIRDAAKAGLSALVVSSEHEELLAICHRILVMVDGEIVAERIADMTDEHELLMLVHGVKDMAVTTRGDST
jgi:ribose transport system ATP-binding protein